MIKTDKVIIVEGKYDKIRLSNIFDATIITTDGFSIFKDREKQKLVRRLAQTRGIIIMTDSDSAGFMIRNFLGNGIPKEQITNVYMPDIFGKEKRKEKPSSEGKLGVEGISDDIIIKTFERAGVDCETSQQRSKEITSLDFYEDGITGGSNSKARRQALQRALDLPERLSSSQLLKIINIIVSYDEYKDLVSRI